jgi:hypothetical protein
VALILASTAGSEVYTSFEDIGLATVIIAEPEPILLGAHP